MMKHTMSGDPRREREDDATDEITLDMSEVEVPITWEDGEDGTTTVTFRASLLPPPIARVGRFDILGRLAVGGMADIFLARESGEGDASRLLVVKFVRSSLGQDEQLAEMFVQEARVAMRLSHPNICHVYEVGESGGRQFIAMQWVNGVTLRNLVKSAQAAGQPLPRPIAVKIAAQIAEALDSAHRAHDSSGKPLGVVHRDVSPHNIMVSYDGVVKLLDFGVAKVQASMTQSGTVKGKFAYMSPEQAQCKPIDGRSDIFSLGIVLYEALTGRRAYAGTSEYDSLRAIIESPVPSPRAVDPDIPVELDAIVQKALAKDRADRFQNAVAMQVELESWLVKQGEVVNSARISRLLRDVYGSQARERPKLDRSKEVSGSFSAVAPRSTAEAPPSAGARRARWPLVALGMAVLGGAASIAFATGVFSPPAEPEEAREEAASASPEEAAQPELDGTDPEPAEPETPPSSVENTEPLELAPLELTAADVEPAAVDPAPAPARMARRRAMRRRAQEQAEPPSMEEASMRRGRFVTTPF